jgi:gluconate 2-dehydrogenase gamma chain
MDDSRTTSEGAKEVVTVVTGETVEVPEASPTGREPTTDLGRRRFLRHAGSSGVAVVASVTAARAVAAPAPPAAAPGLAQAAVPPPPGPGPAQAAVPGPTPEPPLALNATEYAFIVAAVDTLIPADALGPSGSDCGVAVFIDRQLGGAFGAGARLYRQGPFVKGKPEHGYQLPLTPREFFQTGIALVNAWTREVHHKPFDALAPSDRVAVLQLLERGGVDLGPLGSAEFFEALLTLTMEGMFSDPIYGGNRDKAGWKLLGYPGLPATYQIDIVRYHGRRYPHVPQSIVDFS